MKLLEFEGKNLFRKYCIATPRSFLVSRRSSRITLPYPLYLKSQVPVGDRKKNGGVLLVKNHKEFEKARRTLFERPLQGHIPDLILAEEVISFEEELYISFSYSSEHDAPVLALSRRGGTGVREAIIFPIDPLMPMHDFYCREILSSVKISQYPMLGETIKKLSRLFFEEKATIAEINPLFLSRNHPPIAGDAKIILDRQESPDRPIVPLGGTIAVIASGGGASMLAIDMLLRAGGTPANYVEYSGNPDGKTVRDLTRRVIGQRGIQGLWVVGGTANFTDIFETMKGFLEGLSLAKNKPLYPIVVRRDGPRREEAFQLLRETGKRKGFNIHVFGPETSMADSAKILIRLIKKNEHLD